MLAGGCAGTPRRLGAGPAGAVRFRLEGRTPEYRLAEVQVIVDDNLRLGEGDMGHAQPLEPGEHRVEATVEVQTGGEGGGTYRRTQVQRGAFFTTTAGCEANIAFILEPGGDAPRLRVEVSDCAPRPAPSLSLRLAPRA